MISDVRPGEQSDLKGLAPMGWLGQETGICIEKVLEHLVKADVSAGICAYSTPVYTLVFLRLILLLAFVSWSLIPAV